MTSKKGENGATIERVISGETIIKIPGLQRHLLNDGRISQLSQDGTISTRLVSGDTMTRHPDKSEIWTSSDEKRRFELKPDGSAIQSHLGGRIQREITPDGRETVRFSDGHIIERPYRSSAGDLRSSVRRDWSEAKFHDGSNPAGV